MNMTTFVTSWWTGDAATKKAHITGILNGEGSCEVASACKIDGGVRTYVQSVVGVEAWCIIFKFPALALGLLACIINRYWRFGGEDVEIVGDVAIKLYTDILWLEQQELHCGVVLHIGYYSSIVGTYAGRLILLVLAYYLYKNIASEIEESIRHLCNLVFTFDYWGIYFCHVGINLCPFIAAAWTYEYIIVVFQWCTFGRRICKHLMQFAIFLYLWFPALDNLLRKRHLQSFYLHIMIICTLIDWP